MKRRMDDLRRARARADAEGSEGDADPRVSAFLRGVTIGALFGAAIAGSALWERAVRRRAATAEADPTAADATASDAAAAGDEPPPF